MAILMAGACGSVGSDAGRVTEQGRIEISTPSGHLLDCPDDLVASTVLDLVDEEGGSGTPQDAVENYKHFLWQDGILEAESDSSTSFFLIDGDGNRLAWISTGSTEYGWFVTRSEECGSSFDDPAPEPGGPCISGPDDYGDSSLFAAGSGAEVNAAFNHLEAGYCPRIGASSTGYNADGFLATLDETLLNVETGGTLTVRGPGYFAAHLDSNWEVTDAKESAGGGQIWTLQAPVETGRYQVDLRLEWAEGRSHYAVLVDVEIESP